MVRAFRPMWHCVHGEVCFDDEVDTACILLSFIENLVIANACYTTVMVCKSGKVHETEEEKCSAIHDRILGL